MCVCVQDVQTALTPRGMCSCSGAKKVGDFGSPRGAESPCSLGIQQRSVCLLNFMVTGVRRRGWRRERIGARRAGAPARLSAAPGASAECLALTRVNTAHGSTHHDTIDTGVNRQRLDRVPPRHTSDTSPRHSHTRHFRAQHSPLLPAVPLRGTVVEFPASPARRFAVVPREHAEDKIRTGAQSTEHISTHYGFRIGSG